MLRLLVRFVGLLLLAGGVAALVADGTRSIAASSLVQTAFGQAVKWVAPQKYELIRPAADHLSPYVWDPVLVHVLAAPVWAVLGALGLLLIYVGRPPAPKIGFSSRP